MQLVQSIVLGIVQGLTEFLPISSSAHLVLTPYFFGWSDPGLAYDVALHMGTLVAVLAYFWRDWAAMGRQCLGRRSTETAQGTVGLQWIVLGTLPAVVIGFLLEEQAEVTFRHPLLIALTLAGFGLLLWYWDRKGSKTRGVEGLGARDALLIGLAQAMAIVPGVSRSGVTMTAALALGFTRSHAARFSFLLSAPITAGAGLLKSGYMIDTFHAGGAAATQIIAGFVASLVAGIIAIALLSAILKSRSFTGFVIYRLVLAVVIVVTVLAPHFPLLVDLFFHLDRHLNEWVGALGPWIFVVLFAIVFCETGLVVTPFLPGDSLLFALGALAATEASVLPLALLLAVLGGAAILGDTVNYAIGARVGPRVFCSTTRWWLNKKHLLEAQAFYARHGGKTIIFARFIPIIRTFAPFVAGIGTMHYPRFLLFNVMGGILWVASFLCAGYFFGNFPIMKRNFEFVILGIIALSTLPVVVRIFRKS